MLHKLIGFIVYIFIFIPVPTFGAEEAFDFLDPIYTTPQKPNSNKYKIRKRKKVKPVTKPKKIEDDEEDIGPILYEVALDATIESAEIEKKHKKRLMFRTNSFRKKVRKYSIFLVLNTDRTGVLAELVVTRNFSKSKTAYAKVTRIVQGLKSADLVGKALIRFQDLKRVLGNTKIFHENPILGLNLERSSFVMSSVNVITQSKLNPIAYSTGANLRIFVPYWEGREWVNWFGMRLRYHQNSPETINFRLPNETVTRNGILGGTWANAELLIQPWFRVNWIHHIALGIGITTSEDQLLLDEEVSEKQTYKTVVTHPTVRLGLLFNPAFNFYLGTQYSHRFASNFKVELDSEMLLEGKWASSTLHIFGQILQPVSQALKIEGKVVFSKRDDSVETEASDQIASIEQFVSDWGYTLSLGIIYSP